MPILDWKCPECREPASRTDWGATLVGYLSPAGHDHDDNCIRARLTCANGHTTTVMPQRKCPAEGCDWVGKTTCFCTGEKSGIWTNEHPASQRRIS